MTGKKWVVKRPFGVTKIILDGQLIKTTDGRKRPYIYLKLTFVADKPPPPWIAYQEVLMAAGVYGVRQNRGLNGHSAGPAEKEILIIRKQRGCCLISSWERTILREYLMIR